MAILLTMINVYKLTVYNAATFSARHISNVTKIQWLANAYLGIQIAAADVFDRDDIVAVSAAHDHHVGRDVYMRNMPESENG